LFRLPHADYGVGPEGEHIDDIFKSNAGLVQGKLRGFYKIKPLSTNVCRVTFVAQGSMGGQVPDFAMSWGTKRTLGIVKRLQNKYMRNGKRVDAEQRLEFPDPPRLDQLSDEQKAIVARCSALEVGSDLRQWTSLESPSSLVKMWMQYTKRAGDEKTR
jgi:hypothetical protein